MGGISVYSNKTDKINLVANYLMNGSDWLLLVGSGGDGKTMATREAIKLWKRSMDEEDPVSDTDDPNNNEDPVGNIVYLPCYGNGTAHKIMLMKKGDTIVKTIVHINSLSPEWEFVSKEWNAAVSRFERGNEL